MKRLALIVLFIISSAACVPARNVEPIILATPTAKPTTCTIYEMKSRDEMGVPDNGSFAIANVYPGGQTSWVMLGKTEIDYIKSLNVNSMKSWTCAAQSVGTVYLSRDGYSTDERVVWPRVIATSEDTSNRNQVCVSGYGVLSGKTYAYIVAIPQSADYEQYRNIAWLNQRLYASYGGHPLLWIMPLFDPDSGFQVDKGPTMLAIDPNWLYRKIGETQIPWMSEPVVTITPTFTPIPSPTVTVTPIPATSTPTVTNVIVSNRGAGKYLSIRPSDGVNNVAVGYFYPGTTIPLVRIIQNGANYWGEDGNGYYIALFLNGVYYTDWRP